MQCDTIQEKLSAYIDGVLSVDERELVNEHLRSCRTCREALAELSKTVEHIRNLDDIEPPPWLAQKIMTRINEEAEPRKGILRRLFYPLHIKLPLEAVGVVLIAATAFYIYQSTEPLIKKDILSEPESAPLEEVSAPALPKAPETVVDEKPRKKDKGVAGRLDTGPEPPQRVMEETEMIKENLESRFQAPEPAKESQLARKAEETPQRVEEKKRHVPSEGMFAQDEEKRQDVPSEPRVRALVGKKSARDLVTVYVKDISASYLEIKKVVSHLEGKIIKTESFEKRSVVTVKMPPEAVNEFLEELKSFGEMQGGAQDFVIQQNEVVIRVNVVKTPL